MGRAGRALPCRSELSVSEDVCLVDDGHYRNPYFLQDPDYRILLGSGLTPGVHEIEHDIAVIK